METIQHVAATQNSKQGTLQNPSSMRIRISLPAYSKSCVRKEEGFLNMLVILASHYFRTYLWPLDVQWRPLGEGAEALNRGC